MQTDKETVVNVRRFNLPSIAAVVLSCITTIVIVVWQIGLIRTSVELNSSNITNLKAAIAGRQLVIDTRMTALETNINSYATLPFRVTTNEAGLAAANKQIGDVNGNVITSIDGLRDSFGDLKTKVEVQSTKIDTLNEKVEKLSNRTMVAPMRSRVNVPVVKAQD